MFGERGKYIISGGNDAYVKVWDWSKHMDDGESSRSNLLLQDINVSKKVSFLAISHGAFSLFYFSVRGEREQIKENFDNVHFNHVVFNLNKLNSLGILKVLITRSFSCINESLCVLVVLKKFNPGILGKKQSFPAKRRL